MEPFRTNKPNEDALVHGCVVRLELERTVVNAGIFVEKKVADTSLAMVGCSIAGGTWLFTFFALPIDWGLLDFPALCFASALHCKYEIILARGAGIDITHTS